MVCWLVAGFFALWAIVRIAGLERGYPMVQVIAYTPYVVVPALVAVAVVAACRRWIAAGLIAVAFLALGLSVLPRVIGGPEEMEGATEVEVMSFNLAKGGANPDDVIDEARARGVGLVFLQEISARKARQLERFGLTDTFPHKVLDVTEEDDGGGGAIYSRWPLEELEPLAVGHQPRAVFRMPGADPVEVVSVHPTAPIKPGTTSEWQTDYDHFPAAGSAERPIVLAGDFNATLDHANLRDLIGTGYRDAGEVVGSGLVSTWPSRLKWPLPVTIDHVLAEDGIGFSGYEVVKLRGSDHRAVFVDLLLPG